jgi:hypothetical protein
MRAVIALLLHARLHIHCTCTARWGCSLLLHMIGNYIALLQLLLPPLNPNLLHGLTG